MPSVSVTKKGTKASIKAASKICEEVLSNARRLELEENEEIGQFSPLPRRHLLVPRYCADKNPYQLRDLVEDDAARRSC